MVPVHKYFLDKTALIASNRAHGCCSMHRQGSCHVATTLLSSAYRIEAMAKSSVLRLKEFLDFHWSDNEKEGSSDLHDQNGNSPSHVLNVHELSPALCHKHPKSSAALCFLCCLTLDPL